MVSILRHHGDDRDKFGTATAEAWDYALHSYGLPSYGVHALQVRRGDGEVTWLYGLHSYSL